MENQTYSSSTTTSTPSMYTSYGTFFGPSSPTSFTGNTGGLYK